MIQRRHFCTSDPILAEEENKKERKRSPVICNTSGEGRGCRKSLRKRGMWKKLWQRKHSQPVSRSLSFPRYTTSLSTTRCVHWILALHILRTVQCTRTFLTTVGHRARLLTSQIRSLPRFRLPITSPLVFSPPYRREGDGTAALRTRSPLRSGLCSALELPVRAPYDYSSPRMG
jgi:hypothetical protein